MKLICGSVALILVLASVPVGAQPTGTWIGCPWEGTPSPINVATLWKPDGPGSMDTKVMIGTDAGVFSKDADGTIRQINLFGFQGIRIISMTTLDQNGGEGSEGTSLIVAVQDQAFGQTDIFRLDLDLLGNFLPPLLLGSFDGDVRSMTAYDTNGNGADELIAAGGFENLVDGAEPVPMPKTAVLDGVWSPLGTAPNSTVASAETISCAEGNSTFPCDGGSTLVISGFFTEAGGQSADAVACWDDTDSDWAPCDTSGDLAGTIVIRAPAGWEADPTQPHTELIVAGFGVTVDGADTGGVAHLSSAGWSGFGSGFFGNIEAITTFDVDGDGNPEPIAAGVVNDGGAFPFRIRWFDLDTNTWQTLDGGEIVAGGFTQVRDYLSFDADGPGGQGPELIVVGSFASATIDGTVEVDHLAIWVPDATGGGCNEADLAEPFGVLDFFDLQAYLNLYAAGDPAADLNGDGVLDFFDVQTFLNAFADGCP
jgi:hypothetical protein